MPLNKQHRNRFKVTPHTGCALGKWMDENKNQKFAQTKEWEDLVEYHKKVHEMVQDAVDLEAGAYGNGQLFACAQNIEENMNEVFSLFDKLKEANCDLQFKK